MCTYIKMQDQFTGIVAELCDNYRSKEVPDEVKKLCLLLIQTTEMSLYLELCVVQVCRIHPVFGRVDNFSKDLKKLVKGNKCFFPSIIDKAMLMIWDLHDQYYLLGFGALCFFFNTI